MLGWLIAFLVALAGCTGTDSSAPTRRDPAGWIYFATGPNYEPPARVNVETGAVEILELPPPFAAEPLYSPSARFVSPIDGDLTGSAKLGGLFPETFILDAADGRVTTYPESASPFTVSVDAQHSWAPDGSAVVFKRHQTSGCCTVWVLLHPTTGVLDTLERVAERVPEQFDWLGADTLLSRRGAHFRTYALATGDTAVWNVVPVNFFLIPTVSRDRQWVAHWAKLDSTVTGEGLVEFIQLRLRDRRLGTDTLLVTAGNTSHVTTLLSESFDPNSHFLAYCTSFTNIRIRDLATGRTVKDLPVPFCYALTWSWGPEGPPGREAP